MGRRMHNARDARGSTALSRGLRRYVQVYYVSYMYTIVYVHYRCVVYVHYRCVVYIRCMLCVVYIYVYTGEMFVGAPPFQGDFAATCKYIIFRICTTHLFNVYTNFAATCKYIIFRICTTHLYSVYTNFAATCKYIMFRICILYMNAI